MVRKFFDFLNKESGSLNQAALLLGFFSLLSQVLAFLRDRLLAHVFGAGSELDIYYAAFRVPDFLFVTVASMVSLSVLIPFIVEREREGREPLREFVDSVFTFFLLLMALSVALAYFFMPQISEWLFKGFSEQALSEVVSLSRLLLVSPIVLGLSNLLGSLTQAYNRFTTYAISPILYNAGIILGIILLGERMGIRGVAWGVIVGALLHALIQVPFIYREGLMPRFAKSFNLSLIRKIVQISLPRTLTLSMSSVALVALISMASLMKEGSISILSFSFSLQSMPLALIGVSYSLAAFPILTRRFQEKNYPAFMEQMQNTTRFIIFWSLPLTALLVVLRAQIVRTLLGTGLFDWPATRLTAACLALFALSSVFQSLVLLFMRGFYSAGFTRRPFFINLFSTIVLLGSAYGLVQVFNSSETFRLFVVSLMKVEDVPGSVVLMLSLGFSIGTIVNCAFLWLDFEREFPGFSKGVMRSLFEGVGVAFIMGATAYVGLGFFQTLFDLSTLTGIFLQGFAAGVMAIGIGILLLVALRSRELASVWSVLRGRVWGAKVIATDPEIV